MMSEGPDASWRRTLNHVLTAVKKIESIFARLILTIRHLLEGCRSFDGGEKPTVGHTQQSGAKLRFARPGRPSTRVTCRRFAGNYPGFETTQLASPLLSPRSEADSNTPTACKGGIVALLAGRWLAAAQETNSPAAGTCGKLTSGK